MREFNNRMRSQRKVLNLVNRDQNNSEELFGLSENAITRWARINSINDDAEVLYILRQIANNLFFLATKSQEQVTDDYKKISSVVESLTNDLEKEMG